MYEVSLKWSEGLSPGLSLTTELLNSEFISILKQFESSLSISSLLLLIANTLRSCLRVLTLEVFHLLLCLIKTVFKKRRQVMLTKKSVSISKSPDNRDDK